jgi:hypothetical protein
VPTIRQRPREGSWNVRKSKERVGPCWDNKRELSLLDEFRWQITRAQLEYHRQQQRRQTRVGEVLRKAAVKTTWGRERIIGLVSLSFISKRSQRTFEETRQVDIFIFLGEPNFLLLDQTTHCLGPPKFIGGN